MPTYESPQFMANKTAVHPTMWELKDRQVGL